MKIMESYRVACVSVAALVLMTACVPQSGAASRGEPVVPDPAQQQVQPAEVDTASVERLAGQEPYATRTPLALEIAADPELPTPTPEPATEQATLEAVTEDVAPDAGVPSSTVAGAAAVTSSDVVAILALPRVPDTDPAPPLTLTVDSVRLVDDGASYRVTGWIRNDGAETYEGIGIEATFYDDSAWHFGPFDATVASYTLAPGESCAFAVEAYARDYTGYRLHPEGSPLKEWLSEPTTLAIEQVRVTGTAAGYVQLEGVVHNATSSTVRTVRVSAQLLDADGRVTGVGSVVMPGQMASSAELAFTLNIIADTYASYTVVAEAELQ